MDRKIFILKKKEIQVQMEGIRNDISASIALCEINHKKNIGSSIFSVVKFLLQAQNNVFLKTLLTTVGLKAISKIMPRQFLNPFSKSN